MVSTLVKVAVHNSNKVVNSFSLIISESLGVHRLSIGDTVKSPNVRDLSCGVKRRNETVLLCAVAGVSTGSEGSAGFTSVRKCTCSSAVNNVGCNSKDRCCRLGISVSVSSLDLVKEGLKEPYTDLVSSVIIVAVLGEVAFNDIVGSKVLCNVNNIAGLVLDLNIAADNLYLSVLDSRKGVDNVKDLRYLLRRYVLRLYQ